MTRLVPLSLLLLSLAASSAWGQVESPPVVQQADSAAPQSGVDLEKPPEAGTDYSSLEEAKLRYDRELAYEKAHFERELQTLVLKYRQRMAVRQGRHAALLERLKARLARAAKLDAAVEVRDYLAQVRQTPPEPLAMINVQGGQAGEGGEGGEDGATSRVLRPDGRGWALGKWTIRFDNDWTRVIEVDAGQKLRVTAAGEWSYTPTRPAVGPEGAAGLGPNNLPLGRLVARVGDDIYDLGSEKVFEIRNGGVLEMRGNDSGRHDNSGEVEVTVEALP